MLKSRSIILPENNAEVAIASVIISVELVTQCLCAVAQKGKWNNRRLLSALAPEASLDVSDTQIFECKE